VERIPRRAIPSIKPPVLQKRLLQKQSLLLVDLRSETLFQAGHIEGAMNLPLYQMHRRWRELPLDRRLILVDNRGFRSHLAASYLAAKGYAVEPLFGGMSAWQAMVAIEQKHRAGK
jgi:rhodanese-related sulfurtransferase